MRIIIVASVLGFATPAFADTLVLEDGQRLTGIVTEHGDETRVRLDFGTVTFARDQVASIERGSTNLHEFAKRRAALRSDDLTGTLSLARWATEKGLARGARDLYRHALALRPGLEEAHRGLGDQKHDGEWLSPEAYRRAKGQVRYGGQWVSQDKADRLEAEAKERRTAANEREASRRQARRAELAAAEPAPDDEPDQSVFSSTMWAWPSYRWLARQGARFPAPKYGRPRNFYPKALFPAPLYGRRHAAGRPVMRPVPVVRQLPTPSSVW